MPTTNHSGVPEEILLAARRLLRNEDFKLLINHRMAFLGTEALSSTEPADVLKAHSEYSLLRDFGEWIEMIGAE